MQQVPPVPFRPLQNHPRYAFVADGKSTGNTFMQLALDRLSGEQVAIKFFARGWNSVQTKYVLREILNHQHLSLTSYRRIVGFKEAFLTPDYLGVVMEYVEGPSLQEFLLQHGPRLEEGLARRLFQQLVLAVNFCHRAGIVNRDVSPSGIILCDADNVPLLKLSEFAYSKHKFRHSLPCTQVGAALYVAPEVMLSSGEAPYDGSAADVWSCGVILYVMLFGRHPFIMPDESTLPENQQLCKLVTHVIQSEMYIPPEALEWSPGGLQLCRRILVSAPAQRATMDQILADSWFRQGLAPADVEEMLRHLSTDSYASAPHHQSPTHIQQLVQQAEHGSAQFTKPRTDAPILPLDEVFSDEMASSSEVFKPDLEFGLEAISSELPPIGDPMEDSIFNDASWLSGFGGGYADGGAPWYVDGPAGQWHSPFHQFTM